VNVMTAFSLGKGVTLKVECVADVEVCAACALEAWLALRPPGGAHRLWRNRQWLWRRPHQHQQGPAVRLHAARLPAVRSARVELLHSRPRRRILFGKAGK
jgi:hypothetical protein